jgi:hypothetical protein
MKKSLLHEWTGEQPEITPDTHVSYSPDVLNGHPIDHEVRTFHEQLCTLSDMNGSIPHSLLHRYTHDPYDFFKSAGEQQREAMKRAVAAMIADRSQHAA